MKVTITTPDAPQRGFDMCLDLPTEYTLWEFEQGTVQFKLTDNKALGVIAPQFYVQVFDEYRYQREWTIGLRNGYTSEKGSRPVWESHMYRHPGRRYVTEMTETVAKKLMKRFHYLIVNYPDRLFNAGVMVGEPGQVPRWRPRHEGFVHFAEVLLDGGKPSWKML